MIHLNDVAAILVLCGAVAALSLRDVRMVAGGLFVAMAAAPLASSPTPVAAAIVLRVIGALLAAHLIRTACLARSIESEGSGLGVPSELALGAAAFIAGWWATPVAPLAGSLSAQAAGVALLAVAVVPLAGRNALRAGTAVMAVILAFTLLAEAWAGPASPLGQLVSTALLVGVAWATAGLASPVVEAAEDSIAEATDAPAADLQAQSIEDSGATPQADEKPVVMIVARAAVEPASRPGRPGKRRAAEAEPALPTAASEPEASPIEVPQPAAAEPAVEAAAPAPAPAAEPEVEAEPPAPIAAVRPITVRTVGARDSSRGVRLRVDLPPAAPQDTGDTDKEVNSALRGPSTRERPLHPRDRR
jgi:hypothetical protein